MLILIHALVVGFLRGLSSVLLRLFKYICSFLFISFLLSSLTHQLMGFLGLQKTIYVSLLDLISSEPAKEVFLTHDLQQFPLEGVKEQLVFFVEDLGLTSPWERFLLSFMEGEGLNPLLNQVFMNYQDTSMALGELSLHIFSHIAAFYLIFSILALFSLLFICILMDILFSPYGKESETPSYLQKGFSAIINLFLTIFFIFFLLQISSPLMEFFTIRPEKGLLLEYARPILTYLEEWYGQIIY